MQETYAAVAKPHWKSLGNMFQQITFFLVGKRIKNQEKQSFKPGAQPRMGISLNSLDIYIHVTAPPIQPKIRKINMEKYKIRSRALHGVFSRIMGVPCHGYLLI